MQLCVIPTLVKTVRRKTVQHFVPFRLISAIIDELIGQLSPPCQNEETFQVKHKYPDMPQRTDREAFAADLPITKREDGITMLMCILAFGLWQRWHYLNDLQKGYAAG